MSAWIVSKTHIDLLITAALAWELVVPEGADAAGRTLWSECQKSVAHRRLTQAAEAMISRYRQRWGEAPESELADGPEGAWSADSRTILLHAEKLREAAGSVVEG